MVGLTVGVFGAHITVLCCQVLPTMGTMPFLGLTLGGKARGCYSFHQQGLRPRG